MPIPRPIRTLLFDMDGVLYRGQTILPGVAEVIAYCQQHDLPFATITNNATRTRQQYEQKLHAMGLAVRGDQVFTSSIITNAWLRTHYPAGTRVLAIGMRGLSDELFGDGYFVSDEEQPQLVVQGADFELTYERLKRGCLAIRAGARYILTNPDRTFPTEIGLVPGAGAISAALVAATGVEPTILGKPQPTMFNTALHMLGGDPATTLVVGDRLDTDIAGARNAGLPCALVLTGVTTPDELAVSPLQPDLVLHDLTELYALLQHQ